MASAWNLQVRTHYVALADGRRERREGEWTKLHRKAAQHAKRMLAREEEDPSAWRIVARAWEFQKRGVLHMHVVLPMGTQAERLGSEAYLIAVEALAAAHGFGYVDRGRKASGRRDGPRRLPRLKATVAARYIAKYLAPVEPGRGKILLTETVLHRDVPPHITYVSRELTSRTRITMGTLRQRRREHCAARSLYRTGLAPFLLTHRRAELADGRGEYFLAELERLVRGP